MSSAANGSAALARRLAQLSASEMVDALGARGTRGVLRSALALPFLGVSRPLGRTLASFDAEIERLGLPRAARTALERFGVSLKLSGASVKSGALLVLANHPGAYDALAFMAALGREDLLILAADRGFLRALPQLSGRLSFVGDDPASRAGGLRRALTQLRAGGAVLHFPAGQIEPDPQFSLPEQALLKAWHPGVLPLIQAAARCDGQLLVAGARGVHSPRAKRLLLTRIAEKRGVTTLAPLLQMVMRLRDIELRVALGEPHLAAEFARSDDAELRLRAELTRLLGGALAVAAEP